MTMETYVAEKPEYFATTPNELVLHGKQDSPLYLAAKEFANHLNSNGNSCKARLSEVLAKQSYSSSDAFFLENFLEKAAVIVKVESKWMAIILRDFLSELKRGELNLLRESACESRVAYKDKLVVFLGTI